MAEGGAGGLTLPSELLEQMMAYLPLRDLSAMALVSKSTRASISIDMVMLAAVTRTGDRFSAKKSMEELYKLTSTYKIHIPSLMRLLRIATGNQCEFCFEHHTSVAKWAFGSFACWNCVGNRRRISTKWDKAWVRYRGDYARYNAILDHPRNALSRLYGTKHFVWKQHRVVAGERIGPVIAWPDIDAACTYLADTENPNQYETKIDEYLAERLNAPREEDYSEFNNAYLAAKAELAARTERAAREKAERKRKREENKVKREAEKLAKAERKRIREAAKLEKEALKAAKKEAKEGGKKPAASSAPQPAGPVRRSRRNAGKGAAEVQPGPGENGAPLENDGDANGEAQE
ncbi:hypothetical protein ACHAXT_005013 [Thalassiosira profunda]